MWYHRRFGKSLLQGLLLVSNSEKEVSLRLRGDLGKCYCFRITHWFHHALSQWHPDKISSRMNCYHFRSKTDNIEFNRYLRNSYVASTGYENRMWCFQELKRIKEGKERELALLCEQLQPTSLKMCQKIVITNMPILQTRERSSGGMKLLKLDTGQCATGICWPNSVCTASARFLISNTTHT